MAESSQITYELRSQLDKSNKRLKRLETDALQAEVAIKESQVLQVDQKSDAQEGNIAHEEQLKRCGEEIIMLRKELAKLSTHFKELVKKEHVKHLENSLDNWPLEEFITRKEFAKLLKEHSLNN